MKPSNLVFTLVTLAAIAPFAACSSDSGSSTAPAPTTPIPDASPAAPSIVGHWISEGVETRTDAQEKTTYLRRDFRNEAARSAARFDFYADAAGAAPTLSLTLGGPYTIGGPWSAVPGSFEGTFVFDDAKITPHVQSLVDTLNAAPAGTCGAQPFALDVEESVTGTGGCAALGVDLRNHNTEYDLVKVDGDRLYYGARPDDGGGLDTPERRPKALQAPVVRAAD